MVVYIKNFPLSGNPTSEPSARAALAAQRQGKFFEMHALLFEHQEEQSIKHVFQYAEQIGLDMPQFQKDFNDKAIAARVAKDRDEALAADLSGTPMLYLNGREYTDPLAGPFLVDWIDEWLAVNR